MKFDGVVDFVRGIEVKTSRGLLVVCLWFRISNTGSIILNTRRFEDLNQRDLVT